MQIIFSKSKKIFLYFYVQKYEIFSGKKIERSIRYGNYLFDRSSSVNIN